MIRYVLALAVCLWLAACGEPAREWPDPSPVLWEVSGRNGEKAWLFGTIHALPDGAEWRTPAVDEAFATSDLLIVEVANLSDSAAAAEAFADVSRTQGLPTLSRRLDPKDRPALAALMKRAGMDDADLWDTETWAAALLLSNAVRESEPGNGVDRALLADGKPVQGLESFVLQYSRFERLTEAQQRELLAGVVREAERDEADARVEAWLTGDLAALEAQVTRGFLADPALRQTLLLDRNDYFAAGIAEAMERGKRPFVAVGAAHTLGPQGLPALLAARDYTVRRIQ